MQLCIVKVQFKKSQKFSNNLIRLSNKTKQKKKLLNLHRSRKYRNKPNTITTINPKPKNKKINQKNKKIRKPGNQNTPWTASHNERKCQKIKKKMNFYQRKRIISDSIIKITTQTLYNALNLFNKKIARKGL